MRDFLENMDGVFEYDGDVLLGYGKWEIVDGKRYMTSKVPVYADSILVPDFVKIINTSAFCCVEGLRKVHVATVETIKSGAFYICEDFEELSMFASELKRIESNAFYCCPKMEYVRLPKGLEYIAPDAFLHCDNIRCIEIEEGNPRYFSRDGVLYERTKDGEKVVIDPPARQNRKKAELDFVCDGDKLVGTNYDEYDRKGVTNLNLPNGTTWIAPHAFERYMSLRLVFFPSTLKYIGEEAFCDCESLEVINLPEGFEEIGDHAFASCEKLRDIILPRSIKRIGTQAFIHCPNLKRIHYEGELEDFQKIKFGSDCFYNCHKPITVYLHQGEVFRPIESISINKK